jgi:hypothetical protein
MAGLSKCRFGIFGRRDPVVTTEQRLLVTEFKQLSEEFFNTFIENMDRDENALLISEDSMTKISDIASQVASLQINELPIGDRLNVEGFQEFVNLLQSNLNEFETLSSDNVLAVPCSLNFEITKQADNAYSIKLSNSEMSIDQAFLDCFSIHDAPAPELKEEEKLLDSRSKGVRF